MPEDQHTLTIEPKGSYLSVRAAGTRTRTAVTAMIPKIYQALLANNLSKVLIDVTELKGRFSPLDSYLVVTRDFARLRGGGIRKAVVVDEHGGAVREWFMQRFARKRGYNFRIFANPEVAQYWLER